MNTHNDSLEQLLQTDLLQPPGDFTAKVMERIQYLPLPEQEAKPLEWLQWLALVGGALLGLEQLAAFTFGVWIASAAG